jgi:hypothetical protein
MLSKGGFVKGSAENHQKQGMLVCVSESGLFQHPVQPEVCAKLLRWVFLIRYGAFGRT